MYYTFLSGFDYCTKLREYICFTIIGYKHFVTEIFATD
ncbi:Uncharacterised protein [Porphyromonas cangingivalis]|nr:Uncharacterised protein [Porphyromonas cangingivalis]VEJ02254.1 Uncharacterised protein [Porphyromonas cangingivalis]